MEEDMVQVNEELKSLSVANEEESSGKNAEMLIEIKNDRLGGICLVFSFICCNLF